MLKKSISMFVAVLLIVSVFTALPLTAYADSDPYEGTFGDFHYYTQGGDDEHGDWKATNAIIDGYSGTATDVVVPSKVDGIVVTMLKDTFKNNKTVKSVTVPSSVKSLSGGVFYSTNVTKLDLSSSSITDLDENAIRNTPKLTTLKLPSTLKTIGKRAISNTGLTTLTIPASVTTIGEWGLLDNSKLKTITFSSKSSLKTIGHSAFENCSALTKLDLPEGLKSIRNSAFHDCTALTSVTIPSTATDIDYQTFWGCTALKTVKNNSKMTEIPASMFEFCESLTTVNIPSTVKTISSYAFENCRSLKSITIPASVTEIGDAAFADCRSMKNLVVPKTVKKVGAYAIGFINVHEEEVYYEEYEDSDYKLVGDKLSGFKMYVVKDSAAHKYAKEYGIDRSYYRATPKISKITNVAGGVKLSWGKAIASGEKYRVFRKNSSGSWVKLADTKSVTYTDKTAKSGKKYTYTVRCVAGDGVTYISDYNKSGKSITFIATPAAPTLKNSKSGVKITYKKVAGAAKYRIFRKTGSGSWKKLVDTTSGYTDKSAKKGQKYTYTIRCITKDGKSYTSAYNTKGSTITCKR